MKLGNVLLICKKSLYQLYFSDRLKAGLKGGARFNAAMRRKSQIAHQEHCRAVGAIERILVLNGIKYKKYYRGQKINYSSFDFIIAVGGDGTFLEAARDTEGQIILGVNSDPKRSIGRLCATNLKNFEKIITGVLKDNFKIKLHTRMKLKLNKGIPAVNALNDILVCHQNPAAMSRYRLTVNGIGEDQKSSGLWISTATGSSGAIWSAGGKLMAVESKKIQYLPRELFRWEKERYRLKGGIVDLEKPMVISSMMRDGVIYVDGAHFRIPFGFGNVAYISRSPQPLKTVAV